MTAELEDMITVREAARECQRTPETVRRWIWDGKLPAKKLGNQLFVKRSDLDRLVAHKNDRSQDVARQLALLDRIHAIREEIRQEIGGNMDVLEALDRSREEHP